jgi:hypothetical protein
VVACAGRMADVRHVHVGDVEERSLGRASQVERGRKAEPRLRFVGAV